MLGQVLTCLEQASLKLNLSKCPPNTSELLEASCVRVWHLYRPFQDYHNSYLVYKHHSLKGRCSITELL